MVVCRYEIRDISPPAGVRAAMELQAEAERRKRAQILESEGTSQAKVNVAEARKREQILAAEALQTEVVLVAEARKKEVVLAAEGAPFYYNISCPNSCRLIAYCQLQVSNARKICTFGDLLLSSAGSGR